MQVRAKLTVVSKKETPAQDGNAFEVELRPVCDGSDENKQFYKWTPAGQIVLVTLNKAAADVFEVGQSYYVDFNKAK